MGERNDLIERLHTAAKWAFEVKGDCEVSAVGARGHGSKFYAFSEECEETAKSAHRAFCVIEDAVDALRARDATIASLSEALAEAEKKGAEDWQPIETAPKGKNGIAFMMLAFGPSGDQTVSEGLHFNGRFYAASVFHRVNPNDGRNYAFREHEVHPTHWRPTLAPPRDLSQGGQHG